MNETESRRQTRSSPYKSRRWTESDVQCTNKNLPKHTAPKWSAPDHASTELLTLNTAASLDEVQSSSHTLRRIEKSARPRSESIGPTNNLSIRVIVKEYRIEVFPHRIDQSLDVGFTENAVNLRHPADFACQRQLPPAQNIHANTCLCGFKDKYTRSRKAATSKQTAFTPQTYRMPGIIDLESELDKSPVVFWIGSIQYAALSVRARLSLGFGVAPFPLTVISLSKGSPWAVEDVKHLAEGEAEFDDVSCPEFRKALLLCGTDGEPPELEPGLKDYLNRAGIRWFAGQPQTLDGRRFFCEQFNLSIGPYLWSEGKLRPVCRLYDDTASAFLEPVLPLLGCRTPFEKLIIKGTVPRTATVAVPSRQGRLPRHKVNDVVAGKRILVKDVFDMRGLRTTACNRAFHDVMEPAKATAPLIQRLIDLGAHIVGTAKLSSMISREEHAESIDFQVPFNPRADGYQSPAGSSSGSAAAIAAYDWLDYAVGTDTTGSGRRPAFVNGCFALRLSSHPDYRTRMMPCFPSFDAPSLFSRSIRNFRDFVQQWCQPWLATIRPNGGSNVTSIIYLDDYPIPDEGNQRETVGKFLQHMEACYQLKVEHVNLEERWRAESPVQDHDMHRFLAKVGSRTFFHDFSKATEEFRRDYHDRHGHEPPVNQVTRFRWDYARHMTDEESESATERLQVYKLWLKMQLFDGKACPVVVLPVAGAKANYRDTPPSPPMHQNAWDPLLLAPILEAPEFTLPIGEVPFESKFTGRTEYLPIGVSLLGAPGRDLELVDVAERVLKYSQRPLDLKTGRRAFSDDFIP